MGGTGDTYWNYRLVEVARQGNERDLVFCEVYYDADGVVTAFSSAPVGITVTSEMSTGDEGRALLSLMKEALQKPILRMVEGRTLEDTGERP